MLRLIVLIVSTGLLAACGGGSGSSNGNDGEGSGAVVDHPPVAAGYIRPEESGLAYNRDAVVPPQCYTRTDGQYNPCMTCHQSYTDPERPNNMDDGFLQGEYLFSDVGSTNHWVNLFEDRTAAVAAIDDDTIRDYINADNYSTLIEQLEQPGDWEGPVPKIENLHLGAAAFDDQGFAKDGSHWLAFNYKPLPSTFWPTNGSTDDVMIRLPAAFRDQSCGAVPGYSRDTYLANLAIVEMAIQDLQKTTVPPIDENAFCTDLNGDGQFGIVTEINRPATYVGDAKSIPVTQMLYPQDTEFLHTVRYVGVDAEGGITVSSRMKEVRYMRKVRFHTLEDLRSRYNSEKQDKIDGNLPNYIPVGDNGYDNGFGWQVLGFIEAADGHLRKQTREEHLFCMGCHTTLGSTIDETFAFPRKVSGAEGWGYIDLHGMKDAPNVGGSEGEILHYLKAVGGGSEFRENAEMGARWFRDDGSVDEAKVSAADVYALIAPSVERALTLDKAYMVLVREQSFERGRDATVSPLRNVHETIDSAAIVPLPDDKHIHWDIRLQW